MTEHLPPLALACRIAPDDAAISSGGVQRRHFVQTLDPLFTPSHSSATPPWSLTKGGREGEREGGRPAERMDKESPLRTGRYESPCFGIRWSGVDKEWNGRTKGRRKDQGDEEEMIQGEGKKRSRSQTRTLSRGKLRDRL